MIATFAAMHLYGNPSSKLKIVGVTGTNGKTTTATLLFKVAKNLGYKVGLIGTVENIIIDEVIPATHTTPDPIQLNKLLSKMVDKGCEYVFMEVSSHAIDQNRIAGVNFVGGVFTNLTHDHLDYHKSIENYFLVKKKFFDFLLEKAFALTNNYDEHGRIILADTKAQKNTYGFLGSENFHGNIEKIDFHGIDLDVNGEKFQTHLLGKFNAYNLISVISVCKLLGFDIQKVKEILKNIEPPRGRFDHFLSDTGVLCIIDYAHTPDALENALTTVNNFKGESKVITVFGAGGDRDKTKRPLMGAVASKLSDAIIVTSDNPRSEDPEQIIKDIMSGVSNNGGQILSVSDREEAIKMAVEMAMPGDIVFVAGKGHEDYQDVKGVKTHFSDKEVLKKYL